MRHGVSVYVDNNTRLTALAEATELTERRNMDHVPATIDIDSSAEIGRIDPNIYGHFLEQAFFGNIEGGVFDEGSPLSETEPGPRQGLRRDVIELARGLGIPVVRWPGGNFTSPYHWTDGIGPRDQRPRRLELAWRVEESNRFGTDEFLAWCAAVGAQPYLAHSCRDVDDAVRWVEYTNYGGDTDFTRRRAAAGHPEPYGVRYWGIGNEVYGKWQMGHRSALEYATAAADHAKFMRRVDPSILLVAVGIPWFHDQEAWTRHVLEQVGDLVDYVSLHLYGGSTHLAAGADDYDAVVAQALYFEQHLTDYSHLVADCAEAVGVRRPLALAMDEWNIRHLEPATWPEPEPGEDGGIAPRDDVDHGTDPLSSLRKGDPSHDQLGRRVRVNRWSPRTLADALFYAGVFHVLHRAAGLPVPPTMANTVNLVNANGLIVARPGGSTRSATYHVWDLYQNHMGAIAVTANVEGPGRLTQIRQGDRRDVTGALATRPATVPYLDVSATLTEDRRSLRLAVINRARTSSISARIVLDGRTSKLPPQAQVHDLGADETDVLAWNRIGEPDRVARRDRGKVELADGHYAFPPHSITLLSFTLRLTV